ncbi:hypothetical protein [Gottschalkia acidurici]|nr:hypothetical protein [Gottschalkia acidurici]
MFKNAEVIKQGTWKYTNSIECKIRIIKWHTLYGSGDYEDLTEIRNDRKVGCYYVLYESVTEKDRFPIIRGGFLSLQEAIENTEDSMIQKIWWD